MSGNRLKRVFCATPVALLLASLGGCLIIPPSGDVPFTRESLEFLIPGESSRDDVRLRMSEAPFELAPQRFDDDRVWVFSATSDGWGFLMCGGGAGGYGPVGCDSGTDVRNHFLIVRFSTSGKLSDYRIVKKHKGCTEEGLCRAKDSIMMLAGPGRDRAAKEFRGQEAGCSIYVLISVPRLFPSIYLPLTASVDDRQMIFAHHEAYFIVSVGAGEHRVAIEVPEFYGQETIASRSRILDCVPGSLALVRFQIEESFWGKRTTVISVEPRDRWAELLAGRSLAVLPDMPVPDVEAPDKSSP